MLGWQGSDPQNYLGVPHRLSEMPDKLRDTTELVLGRLGPGVYYFKLDGVPVELTVTREPNDDVTFQLTPVEVTDDPPDLATPTKNPGLWARITGRRP